MGTVAPLRPVVRIVAVTAGTPAAFDWAAARAEGRWGAIWRRSERFDFNQTAYYEPEMGKDLQKELWAFEAFGDPETLAADKKESNTWEAEYALQDQTVRRPVNIDPGYLTEAKLVLASTKDRDHRIYLGQGIFAEVTLYYHQRQWRASRWTYADYQLPVVVEFLNQCRQFLRSRLSECH